MFIPDPDFFPSQTPDPTKTIKGGGGGFVVLPSFEAINFTKFEIILFLNRYGYCMYR
jgi:hypothetical protein